MNVIYLKKDVAAAIRLRCAARAEEEGGVLLGVAETGDVRSVIFSPDTAARSGVHISFRGAEFEEAVKRAATEGPGATWIGFVHSHSPAGPDGLSSGDLAQLARLHDDPRVPPCGILALLAVKQDGAPPRLRGWLSKARNVLIEVDLHEVDDIFTAREHLTASVRAPNLRRHALGGEPGVRRFEAELEQLVQTGYTVDSRVIGRGVELTLEHADTSGRLVLTIPAEGWERPPLVQLEQGALRGEPVFGPLMSLTAGWSSAVGLPALVRAIRARGVWPRKSKAAPATAKEAP